MNPERLDEQDDLLIEDLPDDVARPLTPSQARLQGLINRLTDFWKPGKARGRIVLVSLMLLAGIFLLVSNLLWGFQDTQKNLLKAQATAAQATAVEKIQQERANAPGQIYFSTIPEWGRIRLDTQLLQNIPHVGSGEPLLLTQGAHVLEWDIPPFPAGRCVLNIPPRFQQGECPSTTQAASPKSDHNIHILRLPLSLRDLSSHEQESLRASVQQALDLAQSTLSVQPGDHYLRDGNAAIAQESLLAEQRFLLDTDPTQQGVCVGVTPGQGCQVMALDCRLFCSLPYWPEDVSANRNDWTFATLFQTRWTFRNSRGEVINTEIQRQNGKPELNYQVVRVIREGNLWKTSFYAENTSSFDNPRCVGMIGRMLGDTMFSVAKSIGRWKSEDGRPLTVNLSFSWVHASQNVEGSCVANGTGTSTDQVSLSQHYTAPARIISRFGILLAADEFTRTCWPRLPLASERERALLP